MLLLAAALLFPAGPASASVSVVPRPASVETRACTFELRPESVLVADEELRPAARHLQAALSPATGYELPLARVPGPAAVELRLDPRLKDLGPEGYRLDVAETRITVRASAPAGAFYAIQTLRQLFPPEIFRRAAIGGPRWTAPCSTIQDSPRFAWRGALLDPARHFLPKESLFRFIDLMALHKLNVLQLHLVDDTGWRIEIKRYPRLTGAASRSDFSEMNPSGATRSVSQSPSGFYTQDEIREIVKYAADRFVTVMPEIELPGHSGAAIFAHPELGNTGTDNVYNVEDATILFLKNVLDEVLELFPSRFIHIGGDEVDKGPWKNNPRAQAKMKELGLKTEEELQSWFIRQFDDYLVTKGRRLVGWDEILEGGLAANATVMSWRGIEGGIAAVKSGHDVVMAPSEHTYLDYYQSKLRPLEPLAIGNHLPLEKAYAFEPVPKELTEQEAKRVLGAQASLWGEFIPHLRHLEYMANPRLSAFAETVWSPQGARDFADFQERLKAHLARLKELDVNFRALAADPAPQGRWAKGDVSEQWTTREWDVTSALKGEGQYRVLLIDGGDDRIQARWIEVLEDGRVVRRVEQGTPGPGRDAAAKANDYKATLAPKPGAVYTLRASVRSDSGAGSNGEVYVLAPTQENRS